MMDVLAQSYAGVIFEKKWKTDTWKMKSLLLVVVMFNFVTNPFIFGVNVSRLLCNPYGGWITLAPTIISSLAVITMFALSYKIRKEMQKLEEAPLMNALEMI